MSMKSQPENAPGHEPTWNTWAVTMVNRTSVMADVAPLSVTSFIWPRLAGVKVPAATWVNVEPSVDTSTL